MYSRASPKRAVSIGYDFFKRLRDVIFPQHGVLGAFFVVPVPERFWFVVHWSCIGRTYPSGGRHDCYRQVDFSDLTTLPKKKVDPKAYRDSEPAWDWSTAGICSEETIFLDRFH